MLVSDRLQVFREAALRLDRDAMNGRPSSRTEAAMRQIVGKIRWADDMDVADIGCGDGLLLSLLPPVRSRTGIAPTDEEVAAVKQFHPSSGIRFQRGLVTDITLPDASCDVVVCTSVLMLLTPDEVEQSLREFHRICRPGGTVYVGRIPIPNQKESRTILERASRALRRGGLTGLLTGAGRNLARPQAAPAKVKPTAPYKAEPAHFISLCTAAGFEVLEHFDPDVAHGMKPGRFDYLLRRPA